MSSQKQIDANRRNARHSTGPRSPGGKAQARANAQRHGLSGHTLPLLAGEDGAAFDALLAELHAELEPASALEAGLVDDVAQLLWRIRRAETLEAAVLEHQRLQAELRAAHDDAARARRAEPSPALMPPGADPDAAAAAEARVAHARDATRADLPALGGAYREQAENLDRLHRYEAHLRRALDRTLRTLERRQAARPQSGDVRPMVRLHAPAQDQAAADTEPAETLAAQAHPAARSGE